MLIGYHEFLADVDGLLSHVLHRNSRVAAHHVGFEVLEYQSSDVAHEEVDGCLAKIVIHDALQRVSYEYLDPNLVTYPL
jgi:hypothetical protein